MNIREYNRFTGATNTDERRVLKARFPKYDRATHSMITHPEDYGVELIDEAQNLLITVFGPGPGMGKVERVRPKPRKKEHRRCSHRYYFRLDDKTAAAFAKLMEAGGFSTVQDFISSLITSLVEADS